jgi:hypothetical protein
MYIQLNKSNLKDKRYTAIFFDNNRKKIKIVHFGLKNGSTYIDHKDEGIRDAWIARHSVTGDWTKPDTASSLAYHLLWNKPSVSASYNAYLKKFNLKKY